MNTRRAFAIAVVLIPVLTLGRPAAAAGDLQIEAAASYFLDAEHDRLIVSIEYTLTNLKPDAVSDTAITQYFFDAHRIAIPPDAHSVTAVDTSGQALSMQDESVALSDGSQGRIVTVALARPIYYRQAQAFTLSFTVDGGAPRTPSRVRVNPAYGAFRVRAWGDPGLSDVQVVIPADFEVEHSGSPVSQKTQDTSNVWYSDDIAEPVDWTVFFNVRNDAKLTTAEIGFDQLLIQVRAWPGDQIWSDWAIGVLENGFGALQDAIGIDVGETRLDIVESLDPSLTGYAGWYLLGEEVIELGESLDDRVLLHELAHLWFNRELFAERWVNEGLANAYASEIEPLVSGEAAESGATAPSGPGIVPLNSWIVPDTNPAQNSDVALTEQYGYAASEFVVTSLLHEIGVDGFASVFASAEQDLIAYRDDGGAETVAPIDDWRRFLDLLQETGGSEAADDLFASYVVAPADVATLDDRRAARSAYAELTGSDGSWIAPVAVRQALSDWNFPQARSLTEAAAAVIAVRDTISDLATALAVTPPTTVRTAYEAAATLGEMETAGSLGRIHLEALERLTAVRSALDAPRDFFTRVGLRGHDLDSMWGRAASEFEADDTSASGATAAEILALLDSAREAGRLRVLRLILVTAALSAIAATGISSVVRVRRKLAART